MLEVRVWLTPTPNEEWGKKNNNKKNISTNIFQISIQRDAPHGHDKHLRENKVQHLYNCPQDCLFREYEPHIRQQQVKRPYCVRRMLSSTSEMPVPLFETEGEQSGDMTGFSMKASSHTYRHVHFVPFHVQQKQRLAICVPPNGTGICYIRKKITSSDSC